MTPGVPGAPEPRMYQRSGYFLVKTKTEVKCVKKHLETDLLIIKKCSVAGDGKEYVYI